MIINDLPIGTIVKDEQSLYENEPIEWIIIDKIHKGYPTNSVTLLTKNTIPVPDKYTVQSKYENGLLREWLNNRFFYNLSKEMQKALLITDIISNNVVLKDKLFLLSYTEVGNLTVPKEGVEFEYLKEDKNRVANHNWWTRTSDSSWFRWVVGNGGFDYGGSFSPSFAQLRIACNIPMNTLVDNNKLLMPTDKYLIKQNENYYSIKSKLYNNGNYKPLILEGGTNPNNNDFVNKGFDNLQDLLVVNDKSSIVGVDKGTIGEGKYFSIDFPSDFLGVSEVK